MENTRLKTILLITLVSKYKLENLEININSKRIYVLNIIFSFYMKERKLAIVPDPTGRTYKFTLRKYFVIQFYPPSQKQDFLPINEGETLSQPCYS